MSTHPEWEPKTDHGNNKAKMHLGKPLGFTGVIGEG